VTHQWYPNLLTILERHDEAIAQVEQARRLDPLSATIAGFVGFTYYRARMYDLNPAHSKPGMPRNRLNDGPYGRFWYSEPYLTFGEVRLRCVGRHEIYESPVIIGV
jgi:hypothetical protein